MNVNLTELTRWRVLFMAPQTADDIRWQTGCHSICFHSCNQDTTTDTQELFQEATAWTFLFEPLLSRSVSCNYGKMLRYPNLSDEGSRTSQHHGKFTVRKINHEWFSLQYVSTSDWKSLASKNLITGSAGKSAGVKVFLLFNQKSYVFVSKNITSYYYGKCEQKQTF